MADYVDNVLKPLANVKSKAPPGKLLEIIFQNESVKNAHQAFLQSLDSNKIQKASHGLAVQLLNCISAAYYENVLPAGDAVIFTRHSKPPTGDYLALNVKPEICGFLGPLVTLLLARQHPNYNLHQAWSTLVQVAELERVKGDQLSWGQLKTYVAGLKRYRPDMTTVHGIRLANGKVRLSTLSAPGILWSNPTSWTELSPWIAHVVEVYNSLTGRDLDMQYCAAQDGFPRWDVRKSGVGLVVTPFQVGPTPGRTTFACFEVGRLPVDEPGTDPQLLSELNERFDSGVVEGFWKFSWQRADSKTTEAELLTYLHRNGWVPGLMRHYPETTVRGEVASAISHPSGKGHGYVRDILHLGSIGQPLSQCETAGDLLDVMYDLIETHAHLCELGVLHRDVSYYNVMCNPQHYISTHPVLKHNRVLERPCIKKIFGDESGQSCVLLTDLDHATTFTELAKEPIDASKFVVGTQMFMSTHLSDPKLKRRYDWVNLGSLLKFLQAAETDEPDLFRRAFPDGDNDFMSKFNLVAEAERLRHALPPKDPPRYLVAPPTHHDWWHDAESIYWVFLYAFGRARPLGPPVPEGGLWDLCRAMFASSASGGAREKWLFPYNQTDLLSGPLKELGLLFEKMAAYLAVPWHLYCGEGGIMAGNRDHVHVAFRRLILSFKRKPENAETLRVCFDTAAPRETTAFEPLFPTYRRPGADSEDDANAPPACLVSSTQEARFTTAQKRLAEEQALAILRGSLDAPPMSEGATTAVDNDAQESASHADDCAHTGAPTVVDQRQVSIARKRKATSSEDATAIDSDRNARVLKRPKLLRAEPFAGGEDTPDTLLQPQLDASQECTPTVTGAGDVAHQPEGIEVAGLGEPKNNAEEKYDASLHLHSRSAKC